MYFIPLSFLHLRELVVIEIVVGIHIDNLALGRSSQHFDDFDEVVHAVLADEERSALNHFQQDAPNRPDVDHRGVVSGPKDEFGCSVAPRTDIGQVGFMGQDFG